MIWLYPTKAGNKLIAMQSLFDAYLKLGRIPWQKILENLRLAVSLASKTHLLVFGGLTKEGCIASYLFMRQVLRLKRKSGSLFTALYLKQCAASLMSAYGGIRTPPILLSIPVSLNRSGYPRIIPSYHRLQIIRRDSKSDLLVKVYLSFFSLYRIILLAKKLSFKSTYKSIVTPIKDLESVTQVSKDISKYFKTLCYRYIPLVDKIPLVQEVSFPPTWKTVPNLKYCNLLLRKQQTQDLGRNKTSSKILKHRSIFPTFLYELSAYLRLIEGYLFLGIFYHSGALWIPRIRFAFDTDNNSMSKRDFNHFGKYIHPGLKKLKVDKLGDLDTGRIGFSIQQGTKRRLFAIGNYVNQRLLFPLHKWLMTILRSIPMDGTFHQDKPLRRLKGKMNLFCYDLTAATDRFPALISNSLIERLFGSYYSMASVLATLTVGQFVTPTTNTRGKRKRTVQFKAGQPLGYLSSWPLFAFSHHVLVWYCAEKVKPGLRFTKYAILGDDIIIADGDVAQVYNDTLDKIQVEISRSKSLISDSGAGEFAKKFWVRGLSVNLSPISFNALLNTHHPYAILGLIEQYCEGLISTRLLLRLHGASYKVLANMERLSRKYSRLVVIYKKYRYSKTRSLALWFGGDLPLHPYIKGLLFARILSSIKPRDLKLAPQSLYTVKITDVDFEEYSIRRNWMSQWLKYLYWYYAFACDPWIQIDDLVSGPNVSNTFNRNDVEVELLRFGLLLKLYDFCRTCKVPESWAIESVLNRSLVTTDYLYLICRSYNTPSYFVMTTCHRHTIDSDPYSVFLGQKGKEFGTLYPIDSDI